MSVCISLGSIPFTRIPAPFDFILETLTMFLFWVVTELYDKLETSLPETRRNLDGVSGAQEMHIPFSLIPNHYSLWLHNWPTPWWETNSWIQLMASIHNFKQLVWKFNISVLFIEHAGLSSLSCQIKYRAPCIWISDNQCFSNVSISCVTFGTYLY